MPIKGSGTPTSPWDFFHINSIDPEQNGDLLVDSRNTWAAYEVDPATGLIRLAPRRQALELPHGSRARPPRGSTTPSGWARARSASSTTARRRRSTRSREPSSCSIDPQHATAQLQSSFVHRLPLVAPSQGNLQSLPDGHWFVGWGQEPYFSEFSPSGALVLDGHLPKTYQSFTVLKLPWSGRPAEPPAVAASRTASGGLVVRASWNGATDVASWRVLGGGDPGSLSPLARAPRDGFETAIPLSRAPRWVAAQALDAQGQPLATSPALAAPIG